METFSLLGSDRKPMPWNSLDRTHEKMIKSFSLPWNASTLDTSTSDMGIFRTVPPRISMVTICSLCPSYGVMMPMLDGLVPSSKSRDTTLDIAMDSALLRYDTPEDDISSIPRCAQNIIGAFCDGHGKLMMFWRSSARRPLVRVPS